MLNRRNFLKACGIGVVAPLGLVGKAETVQEHMERVTREYDGGPDLLGKAVATAEVDTIEVCEKDGTWHTLTVHRDDGFRFICANPRSAFKREL